MCRFVVSFKSRCDIVQKNASDDTPATPHTGNRRQVKIPSESIGGLLQNSESLRIGNQFGSIKCRKNLLYQIRFRVILFLIRFFKMTGCRSEERRVGKEC